MKNAIQRLGYTCAAAIVAAGLTGGMFAQTVHQITVNLPADVVLGSTSLPAGTYTISDFDSASGSHLFVFRGANGATAAMPAEKIQQSGESAKTSVLLTPAGSQLRIDKLFVQGSPVAFGFAGGDLK